ncbi:3-dehydroquinate synthase [Candidatus Gracilibacteria bacterium]|nr:3-dehydroquinate synthase [Candidatus Gracilibacteria bacterium]
MPKSPTPSTIIVETDILSKLATRCKIKSSHVAIIADSSVANYAQEITKGLKQAHIPYTVIECKASESIKRLATIEQWAKQLVKAGLQRDGVVIGIGGGIVGDMAGFLASIYMRGLRYIAIPTTVLAMADSSLGGKTGVDLEDGKNLLGSFYTASHVVMDPRVLSGLSDRQYRMGFAEIIKHAIIADKVFFTFLEKNASVILARRREILVKVLKKSAQIKMKIVGKDPLESLSKVTKKGTSRMLVNYGHTVGHAVELLSDFSIPHGEAVAIGMVAENRLAIGKKLLKEKDAQRIKELLKRYNLPTAFPSTISNQRLKSAMMKDKKRVGNKVYFALATRIGAAKIVPYVIA